VPRSGANPNSLSETAPFKATLYRYPHPFKPGTFIYVGQESNPKYPRDRKHRKGSGGFGARFKQVFPGIDLPQPIRESVEVKNHIDLNELETIWMFRFHTWRGYEDGMNITFPGSHDYKSPLSPEQYKNIGRKAYLNKTGIHAPSYDRSLPSRKGGSVTAAIPGHLSKAGTLGGRTVAKSGQLALLRTTEHQRRAGRRSGTLAVANKTGIHAPGFDRSSLGKIAGVTTLKNKTGIHGRSTEQRNADSKLGARATNHNRWHRARNISKPESCILCR
jgi:hypothetical protein